MVLTHLAFTLLIMTIFGDGEANKTGQKPMLDIKRRSNIVDEAFLEQKDILLDMLESKLKEVRDKKKKKTLDTLERDKCESMLKNVDVNVKINGISAIGDADLKLNYGNTGKGFINVNATGISNIGQAKVDLGVGDSAVFIPGLSNLFIDRKLDCVNKNTRGLEPNATMKKVRTDDTKIFEDNNETNGQGEMKHNASSLPITDIVPTTASKIVDIVIPTTSTPQSIVFANQPPPNIVPPAPLGNIGAPADQLRIAQAQAIPQAIPYQMPQAPPQANPQALPPNGMVNVV